MAETFSVNQSLVPVAALVPVSLNAQRTTQYCGMTKLHRGAFLLNSSPNSASAITFNLLQATDTAGSNAKALTGNARIWFVSDTTAANPVPVRQADGVSFTTDSLQNNRLIAFEIDPQMLDLVNGFNSVAVQIPSVGTGILMSCVFLGVPRSAEDQAASPRVN